jgi:uncharacterized repeat protein (TIGR03803 family)
MLKNSPFLLILISFFFPFPGTLIAQPALVGMTSAGGDEFGVIFRTDGNGSAQQVMHSFKGISGAFPYFTGLCEAGGRLYGMASQGGSSNMGVLFVYDTLKGLYTKKMDFTGTNGNSPRGSLVRASNGKLYGMTNQGGANNFGIIFEYDPATDSFTRKHDFDGSNGRNPFGDLVQASNGRLYGLTYQGGAYNEGVIFEFNPANDSFYRRMDFDGTSNGRNPFGSFIQSTDGLLYAVTYQGGANNYGVLFTYDPVNNTYSKKQDFDAVNTGSNPYSRLTEGPNGNLYSMTYLGGSDNLGTIYEYDIANNLIKKKVDFKGVSNGRNPYGSLALASNGRFYGQTPFGGANSAGVIFEFDPATDSFIKRIDVEGNLQGRSPFGTLVQASNGMMYAMTYLGGINKAGVLFEFDPAKGTYLKKIDFSNAIDGGNPYGSLVMTRSFKLYGMTYQGGSYNGGTIFEYDPVLRTYSKKFDLDGTYFGRNTYGNLVEAANGKLYGMTYQGGAYDYGTLIEYDPVNDTCIKLLDFDGNNGRNPSASLLPASNGKLYGMTPYGGNDDYGVLFEYDLSAKQFVKLRDFEVSTGYNPFGSLVQAEGGKLYGCTYQGGASDYGLIFEYELSSGTYAVRKEFDGVAGSYPQSGMMLADNGRLYGLTQYGGADNAGVVFEFEPKSGVYTKRVDFEGENGKNPTGNLVQSRNGRLYTLTQTGGEHDNGVIVEYHIADDTLVVKHDFDGVNGSRPFGTLLAYCIPSFDTISVSACDSFISPGRSHVWKASGVYADTTMSVNGCDSFISIRLTILKTTYDTVNVFACDSFLAPDGRVHRTGGLKRAVIPNAAGCDSVISIHLVIGNTSSVIFDTACRSYMAPDGKVHFSSGIKTAIIPNARGCDSSITVNLTVYNADAGVSVFDSVITADAVGAVYQWVDCEEGHEIMPGESGRTFTAVKNGQYAVIVTQDKCSDTSECIMIDLFTDISVSFMSGIRIYPNPADDVMHVDLGKTMDNALIILTDITGREVSRMELVGEQEASLSINGAAGIYLLRIIAGNQVATFRINKK